jgi:hypothetical protein
MFVAQRFAIDRLLLLQNNIKHALLFLDASLNNIRYIFPYACFSIRSNNFTFILDIHGNNAHDTWIESCG